MSDVTHQQTPTPRPRGRDDADPSRDLWDLWRQGKQPRVEDFLEQSGVRDPEQIVMALRVDQAERWRLGQWVPAESYLDTFPTIRDNAPCAVDVIFAEYLLREQRGERPPLEEFLGRFPRHAAELTLQIELHRAIGAEREPTAVWAGNSATLPLGGGDEPADRPSIYPDIPGYEVLGVLGRGGIGVVYRAWQTELRRQVAIKMLHAGAVAGPEVRARFRVEAEALARLRHPNIVQIHSVSEHAGAPFLVLELVEGRSLAQTLAGTPQPADRAAGMIETLARAIHSAHLMGVVHRDLTPANVLLAADGAPKITDFGLAKLIIGGGSMRTATGDLLGTPSYMAPEQAGGRPSDIKAATDVYSLGAILYELLAGRPPFKAEQPMETMRQVLTDEPVAPSRLRPRLPRDLETICLKCLHKEPARRYATAEALADELRRFLERRPIQTRRSTTVERSWRWCRRNPWPAAAAGLMMILAIGATAAALTLRHQLDRLRDANEATRRSYWRERQINDALGRSYEREQARFKVAVEAIKTFHTGVSEDFLLKQDQFKEVRDRLLQSASDFYGKLGVLLNKESSPASRWALWQANYEVAELTNKVGKLEDALAAHRQVLAAREAIAAGSPADPEIKADLGRSLTAVARLLEATGRTGEAEATYRQAETSLVEPAPATAGAPAARVVLADCRSSLGGLLHSTGRDVEALAVYRLARADQEALAAAPGATALHRRSLASTIDRIALLLAAAGRFPEAEAEHRAALAIQRKLADDDPAVTDFRDSLALSHNNLGWTLSRSGQPAAAEDEYRKALAIQQELADAYPAVTDLRSRLALSHNGLGFLLSNIGRFSEAEAEYRKALAVRRKLADDYPAVTDFRHGLALSHVNLGWLLYQAGQSAAADAEYRKALAIQQELADGNPTIPRFQNVLALSLLRIGYQLAQAGKTDEALGYYAREEAIRRKLVASGSASPNDKDYLANCQTNTADLLRRAGRLDAAQAACERALAVREPLARAHPEVSDYRANLGETYLRLGQVRRDAGNPAGAAAAWKHALTHYEGIKSLSGEQVFFRACCHTALAGLAGRPGSAVSAAEEADRAGQAVTLLRRAVAMGYRNPDAYRTEAALDPLRDRSDFRALMMDLNMPDNPFAPGR